MIRPHLNIHSSQQPERTWTLLIYPSHSSSTPNTSSIFHIAEASLPFLFWHIYNTVQQLTRSWIPIHRTCHLIPILTRLCYLISFATAHFQVISAVDRISLSPYSTPLAWISSSLHMRILPSFIPLHSFRNYLLLGQLRHSPFLSVAFLH